MNDVNHELSTEAPETIEDVAEERESFYPIEHFYEEE